MALKYKIIMAAFAILIVAVGVIEIKMYRELKARMPAQPTAAAAQEAPINTSGPCVNFRQAPSRAGENGCISGYVLRAYTSKSGNTFLDFCQDYKNCPFTSVIFASDRSKFGNLEALDGRQVDLRGFISIYNGQVEIIIHDPQQIQAAR